MSPESHELHQICVCGRTSERRKRRKLKRLSSKRIKLNGHRLPVMISSIVSETRLKLRGRLTVKMKQANSTSINERLPVILNLIALSSFLCFTLNSATIQTQGKFHMARVSFNEKKRRVAKIVCKFLFTFCCCFCFCSSRALVFQFSTLIFQVDINFACRSTSVSI